MIVSTIWRQYTANSLLEIARKWAVILCAQARSCKSNSKRKASFLGSSFSLDMVMARQSILFARKKPFYHANRNKRTQVILLKPIPLKYVHMMLNDRMTFKKLIEIVADHSRKEEEILKQWFLGLTLSSDEMTQHIFYKYGTHLTRTQYDSEKHLTGKSMIVCSDTLRRTSYSAYTIMRSPQGEILQVHPKIYRACKMYIEFKRTNFKKRRKQIK